jgi:hypothetical protein
VGAVSPIATTRLFRTGPRENRSSTRSTTTTIRPIATSRGSRSPSEPVRKPIDERNTSGLARAVRIDRGGRLTQGTSSERAWERPLGAESGLRGIGCGRAAAIIV